MPFGLPPTPLELADRAAITDLIHAYCRAMDRMDNDLGFTVWHEGGTADYGPTVFTGTGHGFVEWVYHVHAATRTHSHQVTNILIALAGDTATSEAYVTATLRYEKAGQLVQSTYYGRYLDRWSRREARWGIAHRQFVEDFHDERVIADAAATGIARRDASDPSYALLPR